MVDEKYKISVIVTVYNNQQYLARCLQSIISQSYHNLEIILVDDGSTDGSLAICEKYRQKDQRIRLLHQTNQGVGAARNRGLDAATGDYLCFVDDDDFVGKDYCRHLIDMVLTGQAEIAAGFFNIFNITTKKYLISLNIPLGDPSFDGVYSPEQWIEFCSKYQAKLAIFPGVLWGKLFQKNLFDNVRCPIGWPINEDEAISWQLYLKANRIAFKNYRDYVYSDHNPQAIHRVVHTHHPHMRTREQQLALMQVLSISTKVITHEYQQLCQAHGSSYLQRLLKHYQH
ncbi:glycosyltransferase family 2 protein [uncultured Limosilactobacillus sp.]|uniref:glycosyltransferase family 2 protein n=1 Tax=uncultured Limosilactobacillus sp. TaxID=2837629 RepID=UPI0025D3610C|nr:glycosyltransferase family 2 protein [uncultured Limosilactobacillus sp.]